MGSARGWLWKEVKVISLFTKIIVQANSKKKRHKITNLSMKKQIIRTSHLTKYEESVSKDIFIIKVKRRGSKLDFENQ